MFKFPQQNATKYASVFKLYNIPILEKHKLRDVIYEEREVVEFELCFVTLFICSFELCFVTLFICSFELCFVTLFICSFERVIKLFFIHIFPRGPNLRNLI